MLNQKVKQILIACLCLCMLALIVPGVKLQASETANNTNTTATSSIENSSSTEQAPANSSIEINNWVRLFGEDIPQDYEGVWSINVLGLINDDGSLTVREMWQANMADPDKTELYIRKKFNHMNLVDGSFHVSAIEAYNNSPDNKHEFTHEPDYYWDVDASFEEKAYKYGIVEDGDYTELCFGISEHKPMLYLVDYTLENAFLTYSDGKIGANIRFINDKISPPPEIMTVHLAMADPNKVLDTNNCKLWAFGFKGQSGYIDDTSKLFTDAPKHIMAYNDDGTVNSSTHMTLLLQLDNSLLTAPKDPQNRSFQEVQDLAFEGSDYEDASKSYSGRFRRIWTFISTLFFMSILFSAKKNVRKKYRVKNRKKVRPSSEPASTIPLKADPLLIYYFSTQVCCRRGKLSDLDGSNYINSLFLKWIKQGMLTPFTPVNSKGKPDTKNTKLIVNREATEADFDGLTESKIWNVYTKRRGKLIEEINRDTVGNITENTVGNLVNSINNSAVRRAKNLGLLEEKKKKYYFTDSGISEAIKLTAFEEFIKNYSLLNERSAYEAAVWDNYLMAATACGLGKTALKQMQRLVPDYQFCSDIGSFDSLQTIHMFNTLNLAHNYRESKSSSASGFGGSSSIGGGGGFSGGASGGGAR